MINKILNLLNNCSYEKSETALPVKEKRSVVIRFIPIVRRTRYVKIIF